MVFSTFKMLRHHHHHLTPEHSSTLKTNPVPLQGHPPPPPQPLTSMNPLPVSGMGLSRARHIHGATRRVAFCARLRSRAPVSGTGCSGASAPLPAAATSGRLVHPPSFPPLGRCDLLTWPVPSRLVCGGMFFLSGGSGIGHLGPESLGHVETLCLTV